MQEQNTGGIALCPVWCDACERPCRRQGIGSAPESRPSVLTSDPGCVAGPDRHTGL